MFIRRNLLSSVSLVLSATAIPHASAADAPQVLDPGTYVNLVRLSDGSIKRVRSSNGFLRSQTSINNGLTWSAEAAEFPMAGSTNPIPVLDSNNHLHYFHFELRDESNGGTKIPNVNYFRDVWHYGTSNGVNYTANMAQSAYTGSIMDAAQLRSGRLIVPYGDDLDDSITGYGNSFTKVIYSDDLGQTWQASPSHLISPVPADWNGSSDGACEPNLTQLANGQLWMVMRTQAGALYESRSNDDGATWSAAKPSDFYTSTGPPALQRLDDGRLMLLWNNATMPPKYGGKIVYAGRDALHAAISSDDGKSWSGFREIYLDPYRNDSPLTGDSGTAYSFPTTAADGRLLVITGQSQARAMLRIDPDWLLETSRSSSFSNGFDDWSVFKPFGPVVSVKRDRKIGPELVYDAAEQKNVMHVRRPDSDDPDGAAWNFPMARKGEMTLRVKLAPGFTGGSIALGDRFFEPTDVQGEADSIFQVPIAANGSLPGGAVLQPSQWYTLALNWDLAAHKATLALNGQPVAQLDQRLQAKPGPSYLRLRSTATAIDTAGFYISSVSQTGLPTGHVRESVNLSTTDAAASLAAGAGWTAIRFDDYVPNHNGGTSGNGVTGSFAGTFTGFVSPTTPAAPVGLLVESSTGTVVFTDGTSSQVTSDITGSKNGGTLTLKFVDPDNPTSKAVVSGFAFRFGSTVADNVDMKVYDVDGNEMPDYVLKTLDATVTGSSAGMLGLEDLTDTPAIHSIVFTAGGSDTWLLGSFALDNSLADFAFANFTVVPEPALGSAGLAVLALGFCSRRGRRN